MQSSERNGADGNTNDTGIKTGTGEPGGTDDQRVEVVKNGVGRLKEEVVRNEAEDTKSMVDMRAEEADGLK
jgi:hypothetical protein